MSEEIPEFPQIFSRFQTEHVPPDTTIKRENEDILVRYQGTTDHPSDNTIYSPHFKTDLEETEFIVDEQIRFFTRQGRNFEWKLYDFDGTSELKKVLLKKGFEVGRVDSVMFAPSDLTVARPSINVEIVNVKKGQDFQPLQDIQEKVWGKKSDIFVKSLETEMLTAEGRTEVFLALIKGNPAACAWVRHYSEISFFFGGSTIPKYRGFGGYTALVDVRMAAARAQGAKYVVSECSSDSEKALLKMGFQKAGTGFVMNYRMRLH